MPLFFSSPRRSAARCLLTAMLALGALPALADIEVEITGVEGELHSNVLARLSVQRYRDDDVDADTMQRLADRIDDEVKKALRPLGYYQPEVSASFERQSGDWHVAIAIVPGEPVRVRELKITIQGPGADDPIFEGIRTQVVLREGMRLHHGSYELVKGEMLRIATTNGYLAARLLDEARMVVDPESLTAGIRLTLDTGPRYYFGKVDINQNVIRPALMQRFVRFREGDPYNYNEVLSTEFALGDSLYFSRVDVTPSDGDPETLTVPVSITAEKSRPILSLGAGYGTDTKVRGTASWTDTRVNNRGHRLRFEIKASANTRRFESRYDIPIGDPALEKFSVELSNVAVNESTGYDTSTTSLRPSVTRVRGRWQTVTSLSAIRTTTEKVDGSFTNNPLVPGFVLASVPEGFLGEALFSRGFYSEVIGSNTTLGSGTDFLRLQAQMERSFDLTYQWHLLLRGEIGATLVKNFDRLDGIHRFRAGGDRSVRGFAYNSLSPRELVTDDEGVTTLQPTGGKHIVTASVEVVRDLPWSLAAAAFVDVGNAFNKFGDPLEYAAGLGLRYRVQDVVSIGLDVAKPLSTGGNYRLHLNISQKL